MEGEGLWCWSLFVLKVSDILWVRHRIWSSMLCWVYGYTGCLVWDVWKGIKLLLGQPDV